MDLNKNRLSTRQENGIVLPSARRFTVHTALGLPGNSETAISVTYNIKCFLFHSLFLNFLIDRFTSKPCRRIRNVDRGPRPHVTYNCGVSSLARSAI